MRLRHGEGGAMIGFRRICCPIDFSDGSRVALEQAARLIREGGGGLTLLHVTDSAWPGSEGPFSPPPLAPEKDAAAQLAAWTADAERLAGKPVGSVLLSPPAAAAIAGFARDDASDVIVMSTHGRTGFRRLVLGSVAEAVVRQAPCPVLLVRRPGSPEEAETGETSGMPA
jgi:nucleotide-binding universal stress UspA family protein